MYACHAVRERQDRQRQLIVFWCHRRGGVTKTNCTDFELWENQTFEEFWRGSHILPEFDRGEPALLHVDGGGYINMASTPRWSESAVAGMKLGALLHKAVELQQTFKDATTAHTTTNYWKFGVMVKS